MWSRTRGWSNPYAWPAFYGAGTLHLGQPVDVVAGFVPARRNDGRIVVAHGRVAERAAERARVVQVDGTELAEPLVECVRFVPRHSPPETQRQHIWGLQGTGMKTTEERSEGTPRS